MNSKLFHEICLYALALIIITATVVFLAILARQETPEANKDAIMMSLGALLAAFGAVVQYFFGSSKGSADKNAVIGALQEQNKTP